MSADDYMSTRLGEMLADLKVRQPEPEAEELSSGERLLSTDPGLWEMVQKHRQEKYAAEILRHEQREVMAALVEASEATGMTSWELNERLHHANARGAGAPLDMAAQMQSTYDPEAEYKQRQAQEAEQWQRILEGNRQHIAREDAYQARMRGDEVVGNHSEEVPAADA